METISIATTVRDVKVVASRIREVARACRQAVSVDPSVRFAAPLLMCNVSLHAAQDSNGYKDLDIKVSKWLREGYGDSGSTTIATATTADISLVNPVTIFGKKCKDTADCADAAGTVGVICGLLGLSLNFVPFDTAGKTPWYSAESVRSQTSWHRTPVLGSYHTGGVIEGDVRAAPPTMAGHDTSMIDTLVYRLYMRVIKYAATLPPSSVVPPIYRGGSAGVDGSGDDGILASEFIPWQRSDTHSHRILEPEYVVLKGESGVRVLVPATNLISFIFSNGYCETEIKDSGKLFVVGYVGDRPSEQVGWPSRNLCATLYALERRNVRLDGRTQFSEVAFDPNTATLMDVAHLTNCVKLNTRPNVQYGAITYCEKDDQRNLTYYALHQAKEAIDGHLYSNNDKPLIFVINGGSSKSKSGQSAVAVYKFTGVLSDVDGSVSGDDSVILPGVAAYKLSISYTYLFAKGKDLKEMIDKGKQLK